MGKLIQLYSEKLHTSVPPPAICSNITTESSGHPASFMALLKFYDDCKPNLNNWPSMFENYWREYLNGIQHKIRHSVNENQNLLDELTHLIRHAMYPWEVDYTSLTPGTDDLLNMGVLCNHDTNYTRFTSTLIYRSCVDIICSQNLTRLPLTDLQDPVTLLSKALPHISQAAISKAGVLNIGGPQEAVTISPTRLLVITKHRSLSTRGRLNRVGQVPGGLSGLHRAGGRANVGVPRRTNHSYSAIG